MVDVFLSYAAADQEIASLLSSRLQRYGYTVFNDRDVLVAGEKFSMEITRTLAEAKAVVVLLSRNSKRSTWVERELAVALEKGSLVLPVLLDEDATENWIWPLVSDRIAFKVESLDDISNAARQIKDVLNQHYINETRLPPADTSGGFSVFISYAHKDNESTDPGKRWLNRLLEQLQPLVLQNRVSAWSDTQLEAGEQWETSIKAQLESAQVAVLLVSPAFLASKYVRNSELPILLMKAMNEGRTIIPVIVRPSLFKETTFKFPDPTRGPSELSLSVFQSVNPPSKPLNALEEHEQDAVLLSVAQRILELARPKRPAEAPTGGGSVWAVPLTRNPFFTGRTQVLEDLAATLADGAKAALSGMGGIGKTQTAAEYAYRHRGEYKAVLWAKADGEDTLKADLAALAVKLDLPGKDEIDRDKAVAAVKRWLAEQSGWLLILDNVDDLTLVPDLLRREWDGHILLTTRAHATGSIPKVEVKEMASEEGALFLLRRAKLIDVDDALGAGAEEDQRLAAELTRELGGLPLALDQAGAFIEEMSSGLGEYLELYRKEGAQLRAARGGLGTDHDPVMITFPLAFSQVENASVAAADMLRACAFLAPDAIPEEIFSEGAAELGENLAPVAGGGINLVKVIGEAGRFSLIRRNAKSGTIQMHRVVQQVIKDDMGEETRRLWAERVVRGLDAAFPSVEHKNWPLCEKILPHAQEAARLIEEYSFEFNEAAFLLNRTGLYCHERAQYAEAEPLLALALRIRVKALGPDHPDVATSLNNLASLYSDQGKYAEAEPLQARSLSIREKAFGPNHPAVGTSLINLAIIYDNRGRYTEAEPLYARALGILEKALGPDHPDTATAINNLAHLYAKQDKHAEAEPLLARSLDILEKALGPNHPKVGLSSHNLAHVYDNLGRYTEAEPLYARALGILEKALGIGHPAVATTINNLATLYGYQGRHTEAAALCTRALGIYEKALGPNHPDVAMSLHNLGYLYAQQGKYAEAEPLYVRALGILEKVLGPEHLNVASNLYNLSYLYAQQGKYAEAEPLLARALGIYEKVLGPDHPNSIGSRKIYTELLRRMQEQEPKNE